MKTRPVIKSIKGIDGKLCTSDKDKSNALNQFFSSVFMTEDPNTVPSFHIEENSPLSSITINLSVVSEKLTSLKCDKALGPDDWPAEVFKSV